MVNWASLKGGQKNMQLRNNREFVLECLDQFGLKTTCQLFGISKLETLERLIKTDDSGRQHKLSKVDQADLRSKVAIAGYEALHQRLTEHDRPKKIVIEPFTGYLIKEVDCDE